MQIGNFNEKLSLLLKYTKFTLNLTYFDINIELCNILVYNIIDVNKHLQKYINLRGGLLMRSKTKSICLYLIFSVLFIFKANTSVFAWDSNSSDTELDTHKLIVEQGLKCLENDWSSYESKEMTDNLNKLKENLYNLKKGAVGPDWNPNAYKLYEDHFFDPDTGGNFTNGYISDTADSQTRRFVSEAITKWKNGDIQGASYTLGYALHYFSDISEPHHASNWIGGPGTSHTGFEKYVEKNKLKYAITATDSTTDSPQYRALNASPFIIDFLCKTDYMYARAAKDLVNKASMQSSWEDWNSVATIAMKNGQTGVAHVLYRFLTEVTNPAIVNNTNEPIGNFHVVIHTADCDYAGTNDYVYFGMELENGKQVEFSCDLAGDDFTTNSTNGYEFNITDPSFEAAKVRKVWLRKARFLGDDWKMGSVSIYMKGTNVLNQDVNQWLSANSTHYINVDGLKY